SWLRRGDYGFKVEERGLKNEGRRSEDGDPLRGGEWRDLADRGPVRISDHPLFNDSILNPESRAVESPQAPSAGVIDRVISFPSRGMTASAARRGSPSGAAAKTSVIEAVHRPSSVVMMSPGLSPPRCAGEPSSTAATGTPGSSSPPVGRPSRMPQMPRGA